VSPREPLYPWDGGVQPRPRESVCSRDGVGALAITVGAFIVDPQPSWAVPVSPPAWVGNSHASQLLLKQTGRRERPTLAIRLSFPRGEWRQRAGPTPAILGGSAT